MLRRLSDRLRGYRTIIFGTMVAASGAVLEILSLFQTIDLSFLFSPRSAVIANIVIGVVVIALRFATTGPVGKDEDV